MPVGNGFTKPAADEVLLITSGDLRLSANQVCWPAQREMEEKLTAAFAQQGFKLIRAHAYDEKLKHGFISSQRTGMDVFMRIHPEARLVFATAAWQYSHHVLPGLRGHKGPILTVANWSGQWPGLVGLLNLNGSLIKAGTAFSSIWSKEFKDAFFGYYAYWGTYAINETGDGVIHTVLGSERPPEVGRKYPRHIAIDGTKLVITTPPYKAGVHLLC